MAEHVDRFVQELAPIARAIGAEYGIDPALIITQAAIESGWGEKVAGNNYFGVKSHGRPGGQSVLTHEEINGQLVPMYQDFRKYDSLEGSMRDYAQFLQDNPRYSGVFEAPDLQGQIDAIAGSGYATSSEYPGLLNDVSRMVTRAMPPSDGTSPAMGYAPTPAPRSQNPALKGIMGAMLPDISQPGMNANGVGHMPNFSQLGGGGIMGAKQPQSNGWKPGGLLGMAWNAVSDGIGGIGGLKGAGQQAGGGIMGSAPAFNPRDLIGPLMSTKAGRTAVIDPMIQRIFSNGSTPAPNAVAMGQQAVNQSGDTSTGNQAEAAQVRATAQAWRDSRR